MDKSDWEPIATAPKGRNIRVRLADGRIYDEAHWASDLSGEEQPPFRGWFAPLKREDGSVSYYHAIQDPIEWMHILPKGE